MRRISKDKVDSIIFADSNAQKVGWDFTLGGSRSNGRWPCCDWPWAGYHKWRE